MAQSLPKVWLLWLINLTVLAKDQLPMHFVCEYSKAEITKLVRKEFYPID